MNKMGTIIGFTFKNKVKSKSFLITTLIILLLMSVGMNIPYLIKVFQGEETGGAAGGSAPQIQIGVIAGADSRPADLLEQYATQEGMTGIQVTRYDSAENAELKQALDKGDLDGYLQFAAAAEGSAGAASLPTVTFTSKDGKMSPEVQAFLQPALQQVNAQLVAGESLSPDQIAAMNAPVQINQQELNAEGGAAGETKSADSPINFVIVYVMLILFFMSIMMTGNMIAAEITSEKSSRIMEILITSASPLAQMFGKVIGVFLVGILQIAAIFATVAVNLMLPHNGGILEEFDLHLDQASIGLLAYSIVLYILGYFLYALLYAAVGSIVSRTEELGQATMPIMFLGFAAFYIPLFSISAADTLLVKIASFVPFTSPLSMVLRIGLGEVAFWEIAVSLVILILTCLLAGWLSAKIYRTGVLMYGKRPSIKELRKAMKAYKF